MPDPAQAAAGRTADEPVTVDPTAVQASFDRLTGIFAEMMVTVADVSTRRCPYKDRRDQCTAKFGCRNQRRPSEPEGLRLCGGDDKLDYRSAWERT